MLATSLSGIFLIFRLFESDDGSGTPIALALSALLLIANTDLPQPLKQAQTAIARLADQAQRGR